MARTYTFRVGRQEAGERLDRYLAKRVPTAISRAMIQRAIREGLVSVGGAAVKAGDRLRPGDTVSARFRQLGARARDLELAPQDIPLDVVYEDETVLVVNKPAGLVTHPAPGHWDGTLVNAILWHLQNAECGMRNAELRTPTPNSELRTPNLPRAGIVHRLDKDTSGLLLVAKTEAAHHLLSRQLKARRVHRRYVAVVEGHLPLDAGTVNVPLGRHLTHRKEMAVRHLGGRAAVTHYRVVKRATFNAECGVRSAESKAKTPNSELRTPNFPYTVVDVSLETGRTHQIRVHMAHLGHPVIGDATYVKRPMSFWQTLGVGRHLLHAYQLRFQHPATGRPLDVSCPIPEDMRQWVSKEVP